MAASSVALVHWRVRSSPVDLLVKREPWWKRGGVRKGGREVGKAEVGRLKGGQ